MGYQVGDRVEVVAGPEGHRPWTGRPSGTIAAPAPADVVDPAGHGPWVQAHWSGPEPVYLVHFDEPQRDADGQGPYRSATVWSAYLRPEPSAARRWLEAEVGPARRGELLVVALVVLVVVVVNKAVVGDRGSTWSGLLVTAVALGTLLAALARLVVPRRP